ALEQAQKHRGFCAPNPAVGAVMVKGGEVIGCGHHEGPGSPHAEVIALNSVTDLALAKNSTLYVTLEPCCHWGRTPPCTDLLIKTGIKKVIYGFADPNPQVNGEGDKILRQAGIESTHHSLPEIDEFYTSYTHWWRTKLPYVTAKLAQSADEK